MSAPSFPPPSSVTSAAQNPLSATGIAEQCSWEWDAGSGLFRFSPEWRAFMELPQDAPLSLSLDELCAAIRKNKRKAMREAMLALGRGDNARLEESFFLRRSSGAWMWVLARASAIGTGIGEGIRRGSFTDVSVLRLERKSPSRRERAGEPLFQNLLDSSTELIARLDRNLCPLYMNNRLRDIFLCPPENAEEFKSAVLTFSESYLEFLTRNVGKAFNYGVTVHDTHKFYPSALKVGIEGDFTFWPEFGPEGNVVSVLCTLLDFSDQMRLERLLRFNQRRLEALYQLTQMTDASEDELLRFVVERICDLTGSPLALLFIPHGDLSGSGRMIWSRRHFSVLSPAVLPADHLPRDCYRVPKDVDDNDILPFMFNGDGIRPTHLSHEGELPIIRGLFVPMHEDGRIVCLASTCNKATDYDADDLRQVELFLAGAWSVLRRRQNVRELKRAKENAEHANKVKDQFLANVSHELRTPLNGLLSMIQLLELSPLTAQQREYARTAGLSGQALLRILSDILDFSKMELDRMEMRFDEMDPSETIRSVLSLFATEVKKKGLKLDIRLDDNLPARIVGDEARIRQILFNLVGNALKFTESGVITVECWRLSQTRRGGVRLYLEVHDTGIGIEDDELRIIFEPFTQADSSGTRKYQGAGLGLSIVKKLVVLMGGTLSVASEKGRGTSVHIGLSLQPVSPAEKEKASGPDAGGASSRSLDVLVAEDDLVSQFAIRSFLQRLGHNPLCVPNGRMALEALKLYPFDCLITDIQMPEMDGVEMIQRIRNGRTDDIAPTEETRRAVLQAFPLAGLQERAIPKNLRVAALTAHAIAGYKEMLLDKGMDAYLAKPVLMRELAATLEQLGKR